jgi:methyl-accepting chemotaxis protein
MELLGPTPPGEFIRVTFDISAQRQSLQRTAWELAAAAASILLPGLADGWWAADRTLRPIADISTTAAHVSAGNLAQRLSVKDTHGELGQLATVLNALFARLEDSFTQQTRFISDAVHERRTQFP